MPVAEPIQHVHPWVWRTSTQRWCPICRTVENVQGGLF